MPRGMPDLEDAILHIGTHHFQEKSCRVLFVGASAINLKLLHFLQNKKYSQIALCNRSPIESTVEVLPWEHLSQWHTYDWIILGTKSPNHLIHFHNTPTLESPKLIMDLSVPRNADPRLKYIPNITLMNIDQINRTLKIHKEKTQGILSDAEALIADATTRLQRNSTSPLQLAI
jgi:glutamyl-tRNA reductase